MTTPDVSVIVLNYNGRRWLGPCLDALAAQRDPPPFETIVVDNASTDESVALLGAQFPWVRVVRNDRNLGFAAGNNVGSASASGTTLVFLNNDTVVEPEWLANLCRPLTAGGVDLITSRVVFLDDPAVVDSAGDGYLRAGGAYKRGHRSPVAPHLESKEVFGACGAAFAIRRSLFVELGGFDARFFMVYEDVDLSYRARLAGHRCWYAADAVVRHAGSGTLGRLSDSAVFYGQRNLEWTWIKNTPGPLLVRTAFSHALYSASGLAYYVRAGRFGSALRGKAAALAGIAAILRERRRVQRNRRVSWQAIDGWLDRGWMRLKRREKRARRGDAPTAT